MKRLFQLETDKVILRFSQGTGKPPRALDDERNILGTLLIHKRRSDLQWRKVYRDVPGVPEDASVSVGPRLYEETNYKIYAKANGDSRVSIHHRDPVILSDLDYIDGDNCVYGSINFKSQVGKSRFSLMVDGKPEFDFEVEVFPSKLSYKSDYEQMLAEVQSVMTSLAMEYLKATYQLGTSLSDKSAQNLEWITLLENILGDLEQALFYVSNHPIRGLQRENIYRRTEQVKKVDAQVRSAIRRNAGKGDIVELASGIRARQVIPGSRARQTLNTMEHRWLAQQINLIHRRLQDIYRKEMAIWQRDSRNQTKHRANVLTKIKSFQQRITVLRKLKPFALAEGYVPHNYVSMQLLGAPGYKEAYRACLILSLGLRIEGGPFKVSLKDLSVLYEYWCYLAVLQLIAEETGQPIPAEKLVKVKNNGLQILLERGKTTSIPFEGEGNREITVSYNPKFSGADMLVPQQPDLLISLEEDDWPKVHLVLDAKYRLDTSEYYRNHYGSLGPPEDAINIMHRYRDAILERPNKAADVPHRTVIQAAALFPCSFDESSNYDTSKLWRTLQTIGVGALPFLPDNRLWVRNWLRSRLEQGGFTTAHRTIAYNIHEQAFEWRIAASEVVLVAVLRGENPGEHLDWIADQRLYYMPFFRTQPRQMNTRWVVFYSPKALRKPGGVTHLAPVERMDIVKRKAIKTPWAAKRNPDELQVLYHLGEIRELERTIDNLDENDRGYAFRRHRWTSRLALERAQNVKELLLETEPEWRLYEDLRAAGIEVFLEPGPVKMIDPDNPQGRVKFVIPNGSKIRYAGSSGHFYQSGQEPGRYFLKYQELLEMVTATLAL